MLIDGDQVGAVLDHDHIPRILRPGGEQDRPVSDAFYRFIAYLAYNLVVVLEDRVGAFANVIYFLLVYFLFTAIEIGFLYRKVSPPSRP